MSFASDLREARRNAKLTQAQVASLTKHGVSTIRAWESGDNKPHPSTQKLVLDAIHRFRSQTTYVASVFVNDHQYYEMRPDTASFAGSLADYLDKHPPQIPPHDPRSQAVRAACQGGSNCDFFFQNGSWFGAWEVRS